MLHDVFASNHSSIFHIHIILYRVGVETGEGRGLEPIPVATEQMAVAGFTLDRLLVYHRANT